MFNNDKYLQLVTQAQTGNYNSTDQLATLVQDRLYPYIYRITLDHDLAQDILQETLLTMLKKISSLRQADRFWPWIYQIASSKTCRHFRAQQLLLTRQRVMFDDRRYQAQQQRDDHTVLKSLVHKESLRNLYSAVEQLKNPYRQVVQLRCFKQLPYSTIASLAHCTIHQARIRFHRAKQMLKHHQLTYAYNTI